MEVLKEIREKSVEIAREEIRKYGLPSMFHLDLSLDAGKKLAKDLKADEDIVQIGIALMDVKLGQAFHDGVQAQHVKLSKEFAEKFLEQFNIPNNVKDTILNCVEAHHAKVPFQSLEAEICANADCYRFVHPKGVLYYFTVVARRFNDFEKELNQVEAKLDEKMQIASIPAVKEEFKKFYDDFKTYINMCRE